MKSNLVLLSTWFGSDARRAKMIILLGTLALSVIGAGVVAADGPMPGGPDIPRG